MGDDLRFYADQRFKVLGVFLVANGLLANVAKDERSVALSAIGAVLAYLCFSWEMWTSRWWGVLFEGLKGIERKAIEAGLMDDIYAKYPRVNGSPFPRASLAVRSIYVLGLVGWLLFGLYSWPMTWASVAR